MGTCGQHLLYGCAHNRSFFVAYLFLQGLFTICLLDIAPEHTFFVKNNIWPALGCIALTLITSCAVLSYWEKCSEKEKQRWKRYACIFCFIMATLVLTVCLIWIRIAPKGLYSNQHELVTAAGQLLVRDYRAWLTGGYAYECPYQNGLILLLAFLQQALPFWECDLVFRVLNAIAAVGSAVLFGRLLEAWGGGRAISLLKRAVLLFYFPFFLYSTFVYGTILVFFW